jgi:hypothetical protein
LWKAKKQVVSDDLQWTTLLQGLESGQLWDESKRALSLYKVCLHARRRGHKLMRLTLKQSGRSSDVVQTPEVEVPIKVIDFGQFDGRISIHFRWEKQSKPRFVQEEQ